MIKKLRLKLIMITLGVLLAVFFIVFATLNIYMNVQSTKHTERFLENMVKDDGVLFLDRERPKEGPPKEDMGPKDNRNAMTAIRFFYVKFDHDGNEIDVKNEMIHDFSKEEAILYAKEAASKKNNSGTINDMQYLAGEKEYGIIVVFAERSIEARMLSQLMNISIWVAMGSFAVILFIAVFISKWAVLPVKEAFDKQKQFVSDASHELKTPLTIIMANADVLENELGANHRLEQIKSQSVRMSGLIHDLLTLARTDEADQGAHIPMEDFDLSNAVLNTTLEFESRIFEEAKTLKYQIEENMIYHGNAAQIKQTVAILIDNAIRHSYENSEIKVTLLKEGSKTIISVFNMGSGIAEGEKDKIFDRFYRSDPARSRTTGGYGLGLSIAKAIVEIHHGKISITQKENKWIKFTITL